MQSIHQSTASLWQKIEHVRVGMLTTRGSDGALLSRPMTNQKVDDEGVLWFFASDNAAVSHQIAANSAVNASFVAPKDHLYVSVSGEAEIVKDSAKIKEMWNPLVGAWFPGGPDDSHVALIKVKVNSAEYWDSDKSTMMQLFVMAKAAIIGEPPMDIGQHKKFSI